MRKEESSLKEERRRDAQPIRGQKKEERSERDAAEIQDPSDLFTNVRASTKTMSVLWMMLAVQGAILRSVKI